MRYSPCGPWVLLLLASGCGHDTPALTATWSGADSGRLVVPAVATWCRERRLLEISAVKDDSGLALIVYPGPHGTAGTFPLFDPLTDSTRRPSAAVAARWPKVDVVLGYRSIDGVAHLAGAPGTISGSVQARLLRSGSTGAESLSMRIEFPALPIDTSTGSCPPDTGRAARSADSSRVP